MTMHARPVAVIAVSLLLIAGATGFQLRGQIVHLLGVDRPVPGSAPQAIGNKWDCSSGWIKAYQSGMVFYPSYHPAPPPLGVKPSRCYRNASEAMSAGFKLAPPPTGGALLDGVYLVPAGAQTMTACQAAATQLGIVIPCPTLVPAGADTLCTPISFCMIPYDPGLAVGADTRRLGGFTFQFTLATPPEYPGALTVGPAFGQVQVAITAVLSSSPMAQEIKTVCTPGNAGPTAMGRPSTWITCRIPPARAFSSLTWELDNASYEIGSSDQTPAARHIVQFLASKLVPVSPVSG
jgi:hypothetical protein